MRSFSVSYWMDTDEAESVSEAIARMDEADEIAYLLSIDWTDVYCLERRMRAEGFEC